MQCKCGGVTHSTYKTFDNKQTAEAASGREIRRVPCTVVHQRCPSCTREYTDIWYSPESKQAKTGLLHLFSKAQ